MAVISWLLQIQAVCPLLCHPGCGLIGAIVGFLVCLQLVIVISFAFTAFVALVRRLSGSSARCLVRCGVVLRLFFAN